MFLRRPSAVASVDLWSQDNSRGFLAIRSWRASILRSLQHFFGRTPYGTYVCCTIIPKFIQHFLKSRAICTPFGQQLPYYPWLSSLSRASISFLHVFNCGFLIYTPSWDKNNSMGQKVAFETFYISQVLCWTLCWDVMVVILRWQSLTLISWK